MRDQVQRYPLQWPQGWTRTEPSKRQAARFGRRTTTQGSGNYSYQRFEQLTIAQATLRLQRELDRLGASVPAISSNVELRLDGMPRSDRRAPADPGVAVYFNLKGRPRCLACDRWSTVADNIAAVAAHVEAIRAVDRYGVGNMEQAFAGYTALQPAAFEWWIILGVSREASEAEIDAAFKALARKHHPDLGGDPLEMARLNQARDSARQERGAA